MGTRWGISRSVAQIHALLYIHPDPLPADVICDTLGLARSNVSNSVKELQGWGIVKVVHVFGDRRDHFESMTDVWEMFRVIFNERKKREADPTIDLLRDCMEKGEKADDFDDYTRERIEEMLDFFETMIRFHAQASEMSTDRFKNAVKAGDTILKLLK
jgi:DNA-binding transcriptional regulator GbsR (MarR family)